MPPEKIVPGALYVPTQIFSGGLFSRWFNNAAYDEMFLFLQGYLHLTSSQVHNLYLPRISESDVLLCIKSFDRTLPKTVVVLCVKNLSINVLGNQCIVPITSLQTKVAITKK